MKSERLRVAVLLECASISAWMASVLSEIQSGDFARVEAILLAPPASQPTSSPMFSRYEQWDYKRNKVKNDALAVQALSPALSALPTYAIDPASGVSEPQLAAIHGLQLDVILRFTSSIPQSLADAARFGVWSFRFDDEDHASNDAALFWRVFDRDPVAPCSLVIASHGQTRTAYEGLAATDPASLYRTRNAVYWKIAAAAGRALEELHRGGTDYLESLPISSPAANLRSSRKGTPGSLSMVRFLGLEAQRWLQARAGSSTVPKWCIYIRARTPARAFDDPSGYTMMPSAADRFYADPFLYERDGKTYLFFEDFRYAEGRAVISVCELDAAGKPGAPVEVLRRPYHLSYPFVFEDNGEIYMIPETRGNHAIELYRATSFPGGWVQEDSLVSRIAAVDATLQRIDGKFWMFTSVSNGAYSNSDELYLYSSDTLKGGNWKPHPKNPVVSDVQRARPAGRLFDDAGRLTRPSQDCGKAYGYALVFSEIVKLTETEYEERVIGRITPDRIPHAISNHTYNRTDSFEVVDRTMPARIANGEHA